MSRARFAVALVVVAGATAAALDHPEEARKLTLLDATKGSSLVWSARTPPPPLPASAPTVVGATLTVRAGSGETASFDLPASGWSADESGTAFRFTNKLAPGGPSPVERVTLKAEKSLKVSAEASGITLDEVAQRSVTVVLAIGDDLYCSTCTAPRRDRAERYSARDCPAPASCSTTTVTSSSTSTTSTTFVPGVCGNGVVDADEQCDDGDLGVCAQVPPSFPITCGAPGSANPCVCCGPSLCALGAFLVIPCCGDAQCQDTQGYGQQRGGVCIPPSCTQDADCHGYRCVNGLCCGDAGQLCGVAGCCPDSGATCSGVVWLGAPVCCRPSGAGCSAFNECCSGSCAGAVCD